MSRYAYSTIAVFVLLALVPVHAQQSTVCEAPPLARPAGDAASADLEPLGPRTVQFQAGAIEARLGDDPGMRLQGGVLLRHGDRVASAESASYDAENRAMLLSGGVQYADPGTEITGTSAEFAYNSGRIRFEGAEFKLGNNASRGAAQLLEINQDGTLKLDQVSYTTCPPGSNDWLLQAGDIDLDTRAGIGRARDVKLRFQGVPILYTPILSFPIGDARKTGLLTPEIGSAGRSGNELRVPWYWNIAPNYDATLTPRLLTDRGFLIGSEFRYLTLRNSGMLQLEYLADDNLTGTDRHLITFDHGTIFDNGWRNRINFREASDSGYFEDLGGSLSVSSITHLDRSMVFDYFGEHWWMLARVQDYQTIDDAIAPLDEPYRRMPQVRISGAWPRERSGLHYGIDGEVVYFDRDEGATGWRFDIAPRVEWSLDAAGWFVTPGVTLEHTRYELDDTAPGQARSLDRTLPIASLDSGLVLERRLGDAREWIQTLEPRVLYVHVPHRDQDDFPVFDTIVPDLNLVQLYRKNRFLGIDRIADTDQLSVGVTSRVLEADSGKELMTATIGQALYLSSQGVNLPGQPALIRESSDYIAEVRFLLYEHLNFDIGHQWGTGDDRTTQSEARLQYRPQSNKILNLAYRFRRDSIEQGDVSWSWPLTQRWNFVGRYNFSFRDDEALEQFFGIEYESCCWGLRLVSRRHISTRDGTRDSSFGLQLVLKGMTSVGTAADKLLERGILGYSADID
ncbi:MAG: LPS assembly protein LptD [Woeseia sp.]